MLEAGEGDGMFQGLLRIVLEMDQTVDQPRREGIAGAYPVHDIGDGEFPRHQGSFSARQHSRPVVVVGGTAFAQGDRGVFGLGISG